MGQNQNISLVALDDLSCTVYVHHLWVASHLQELSCLHGGMLPPRCSHVPSSRGLKRGMNLDTRPIHQASVRMSLRHPPANGLPRPGAAIEGLCDVAYGIDYFASGHSMSLPQ